MNTLVLWIDSSFPEQHTACRWWLLSAEGRLLEQGNSEPRHWPGVGGTDPAQLPDCAVLLSAEQAVGLIATLPGGRTARSSEVLRYAVEDQLIDDPEDYHLVVGEKVDGNRHHVIAIARRRVETLLASLRQAGLVPTRMTVAAQAIDVTTARWSVLLDRDGGSISTPEGWLALEPVSDSVSPPATLRWLASTPRFAACDELRISVLDGEHIEPTAWQQALGGTACRAASADFPALCRSGANLLQGEFTPPREKGLAWRQLLPLAKLAALAAALATALLIGEWAWLSQRVNAVRKEQLLLARGALPPSQIIVSPVVQLQRAVDGARHARGELSDSDLLPLLARFAEASGARIDTLRYRDSRLELTLTLADAAAVETLRGALRQRGIGMKVQAAETTPQGQRVVLMLSAGELS